MDTHTFFNMIRFVPHECESSQLRRRASELLTNYTHRYRCLSSLARRSQDSIYGATNKFNFVSTIRIIIVCLI